MKELYYVSGNEGKQKEVAYFFKHQFPEVQLTLCTIDLVEIQSLDQHSIALNKAEQAWKLLKQPLLIDDSGFYFASYDRFPGTMSKFVFESLGFEGLTRLYNENDPASFDLTLIFMYGASTFQSFHVSISGKLTAPPPTHSSHLPYLKIFKPENSIHTLFELKQHGSDDTYNSRILALKEFKQWYHNTYITLASNNASSITK